MKSPKITKDQIIEGAKFEMKNGKFIHIVKIEKDGYKKGDDRITAKVDGSETNWVQDYADILWFINSKRK